MALIAHWPLMGNLNDYSGNNNHLLPMGTETITETNSGKLGKAYERTSSVSTHGYLRSTEKIYLPNDFTMSAWIKATSSGTTANGVVSNHEHATNSGSGITLRRISATDIRVSINSGTGSGRTYHTHYGTTNIYNKWSLATITYTNGAFQIWTNGVLENEIPYNQYNIEDYVGVFKWSLSNSTIGYDPAIAINDVRIYDHAITEAEIQEIYKAKILHYDFNDPSMEGTTNYANFNLSPYGSYATYTRIDRVTHQAVLTGASNTLALQLSQMRNQLSVGSIYTISGYLYKNGEPYQTTVPDLSTYHRTTINRVTRADGYFEFTQTYDTGQSQWLIHSALAGTATSGDIVIFKYLQMEIKDHATPFTEYIREPGIISDLSGYGFDGIQELTPLIWSKDSPVSSGSAYFNASRITTDKIFHDDINQEWTLSAWVKLDPVTVGNQQLNNFNLGNRIIHAAGNRRGLLYANSGVNDHYVYTESNGLPIGEWFHLTYVYNKNGLVCDAYFNGEFNASSTNFSSSDDPSGFAAQTIFGANLRGSMSDIRLYATELSAKDIKDMYQDRAEILRSGEMRTHEFKERINLLEPINEAIRDKEFKNGLSRYTQSNTQVSITDNGYRIYRTPNVNQTNNGNTMWGGLRIRMGDLPGGVPLEKDRSYRLIINTNGRSTRSSATHMFSNNMGWGGGGLTPSPTTIGRAWKGVPANFDGTHNIIWEFKIEDDLYKVCTNSYSSFVVGQTYLSYADLQLGWAYEDTGDGTEVYITGVYLYDITDDDTVGITDRGIGSFDDISEIGIHEGSQTYLPLNDGTIRDLSGGPYNITVSGEPKSGGNYFYFDGSDHQINTGNTYPTAWDQPYTIIVEVMIPEDLETTPGGYYAGILSRGSYTGSQGFAVNSNVTNYRMWIRTDSGINDLNLGTIVKGEWAQLIGVWNGKDLMTGFYNGNKVTQSVSSFSGTPSSTNPTWLITPSMAFSGSSGGRIPAGIRNVKIFNRALTDEEAKIEYNTMFKNQVQIHETGTLYAKEISELL